MIRVNKTMLSGIFVSDPVQGSTHGGTAVANFRLAHQLTKDKTCFIDCAVFGAQAECVMQYCMKGSIVLVEARLEEDTWTDDSGNKRFKHYLTCNYVHFVNSPADNQKQNNTAKPIPNDF